MPRKIVFQPTFVEAEIIAHGYFLYRSHFKDLNVPVADVVEMDAYMSEGDVSTEALMDLEGEDSPETALIAQQDVQMQQRMLKALGLLTCT